MNSRGFTLIELMIVVAIIGILAGIPIEGFKKLQKRGYESGAISTLKHIKTRQQIFRDQDKDGDGITDFATGFSELLIAGLISKELASGEYGRYTFVLTGSTLAWTATATPTPEPPITGDRSFYIDETGILRVEPGPGANASSPPLY
jgi:prepilin-type N-terminal cleavage/methylation domain-containing protein